MAIRLAQLLLVLLSVGGALGLAAQITTFPDHPLADMTHVMGWVRHTRDHGPETVYAGVYPETYMIYPPGMTYAYRVSIWIAENVPPFASIPAEDWLRVSVKLVPVLAHGVLALALFWICATAGGFWRGWAAASLYAWSPGALFDAAYWGQGDSINVALIALAVAVLFALPPWWPLCRHGRWRLLAQPAAVIAGAGAGALIAAAGLTKPQTWVFLPILVWVTFRRAGPIGLGAGIGTGLVTVQAIVAPWVRAGTMDEMLSVFTNVTQVMPSVSANAHNLWWLKLPGVALAVFDTLPVGGIGDWVAPPLLNHATVGRLGFGLFALLPLLRLTGPLSVRLVMACLAFTSAAYFMTVTQVHENHMFAALPFLAAAAALDAWFLLAFLIATVCVFFNLALHDFLTGDSVAATLAQWLPWKEPLQIQTANAALNVGGFALLTLLLLRRPPVERQSARVLRWRARLVLVTGLALAGGALLAVRIVTEQPEQALRVWERLSSRALEGAKLEVHLGHKTPPEVLLERGALEMVNGLYLLACIAVIIGAMAALAALWWLGCAWWAARQERARTPRAPQGYQLLSPLAARAREAESTA